MHAVNYRPIPGKDVTTGEVFMADCLEVYILWNLRIVRQSIFSQFTAIIKAVPLYNTQQMFLIF